MVTEKCLISTMANGKKRKVMMRWAHRRSEDGSRLTMVVCSKEVTLPWSSPLEVEREDHADAEDDDESQVQHDVDLEPEVLQGVLAATSPIEKRNYSEPFSPLLLLTNPISSWVVVKMDLNHCQNVCSLTLSVNCLSSLVALRPDPLKSCGCCCCSG